MSERDPRAADDWGASFEARRLEQLTLGMTATPAQRLAWLEEMIVLAHQTGALPRHEGSTPGRDDSPDR